ncbi:hypothetical protein F8388_012748 [Cannabis sativa]|uniref:Uncharacterized protein n=1 Tax=Cannabis sativa TaxID=3483 RepID=A0A7J6HAN2_CANSA|nr:hypothetical protein F8388_012748 [Cannabis sativa]
MYRSIVALLKLTDIEYCGTTSYFIKILLEKKYALPYRALDALVAHFVRFSDDTRIMPVIWHQSLLAFVQRYKNELQKEDKVSLRALLEKQNHKLITPEITRELNNSCNRGEKEDDLMLIDILCLIFQRFLWRKIDQLLAKVCKAHCVVAASNGETRITHNIFDEMPLKNVVFFNACSTSHYLWVGLQIHAAVVKIGLDINFFVGNGLVSILLEARQVLDEMPTGDVVSWNLMVAGC